MRFSSLASLLATLAVVAVDASPLLTDSQSPDGRPPSLQRRQQSRHVLHERRPVAARGIVAGSSSSSRHALARRSKAHEDTVLPMRIGLRQQNIENGEAFLMDVSDPSSPNYGRHWTPEKIADTFAAHPSTIDAVLDWLVVDGGIARERVRLSQGRNWMLFNASVGEMERLLRTEYHVYEESGFGGGLAKRGAPGAGSGGAHIGCEQYYLPESLREHIDLVLPTVQAGRAGAGGVRSGSSRSSSSSSSKYQHVSEDVQELRRALKKRDGANAKVQAMQDRNPNVSGGSGSGSDSQSQNLQRARPGIMGQPSDVSLTKQGAVITNALMDLSQCDSMITPACLRALYALPEGTLAFANNSIGIVEYTPQAILQSDLDLYFTQFAPSNLRTKAPVIKLLDNGVVQTQNQSFNFNGESALDLEFAMALVAPQTATLFQVGDLVQGASFNNLLDSLDGSYCSFNGGDSSDPNVDGQYSNAVNCGTATPPNVLSTSYSYNEADLTPAYEQRQCTEYMKLGLRGVTILYSSGDFGVAGNGDTCIDPLTGAYNNGSAGVFNPSFPGSCPFITSVGATQLQNGSSVRSAETACEKVIFSGGGFSNVFAVPSYQQRSVATYFSQSPPPYGATRFNNSRAVRGFPDVSANGANYVTAVNGNFTLSFGTSASAPTFAAVINLINEQRLSAGKGPVGFINPVLYANPQVLNDITQGNNPGCGTNGFSAVKGWDPLTGLGTPNYPAMLRLFMSLP